MSQVRDDWLTLLPVERALRGEVRYTLPEAARESGLSEDFICRDLLALGLPRPEDGEPALGDAELDALQTI